MSIVNSTSPVLEPEELQTPIPVGLARSSLFQGSENLVTLEQRYQDYRNEIEVKTQEVGIPDFVNGLFLQELVMSQKKALLGELIVGIDSGRYSASPSDYEEILSEYHGMVAGEEYLQELRTNVIDRPDYFYHDKNAALTQIENVKRSVINTPFGRVEYVFPADTVDEVGFSIMHRTLVRNYEMFFKGIQPHKNIDHKTFIIQPSQLKRPHALGDIAFVRGEYDRGVPAIGPSEFTSDSIHEQVHQLAYSVFGISKVPFVEEAISTIIERYWLPGHAGTNKGRRYGAEEFRTLATGHEIEKNPRILYDPELLAREVFIPKNVPIREYYYRYGINLFSSIIEYLQTPAQGGNAITTEDAVRRCVEFYSYTCSQNIATTEGGHGDVYKKRLVQDDRRRKRTHDYEIIEVALQNIGIDPADKRFIEILKKHQLSDTSAEFVNMYH